MFVLSVEGPGHIDKGNWSTHKIIGVYTTRDKALEAPELDDLGSDDDIVILTDMATKTADRIEV